MKKVQCEMCGSNDLIKHNGLFQCSYCGMQYTLEEAKKLYVEGTVKIDNSDFINKQLRNARRAYEKEDWEEVEKYYNIVEQHDPSNIEAIFYSSFAKVKLSLFDSNVYKRGQKFHVLARSISVLDDHYDKTKGRDNEITIKRISADILNLTCCSFIYNYSKRTVNGITSTYNDKYKTYEMFGKICISFIESLENIIRIDEQIYMYYILAEQARYVSKQRAVKRSIRKVYKKKMLAAYDKIKESDPNAVLPAVRFFKENNFITRIINIFK